METVALKTNYQPEQLLTEYGTLVSSICRRMLQDVQMAEDAAQEVWLEVLKSLPSFQGRSKLSTWLYTIASRVVMNYAKKERHYSVEFLRECFHQAPLSLPPELGSDKQVWVKEMCDKCLTAMLHCLDNESRLAYLLKQLAGLPYKELAEVLERDEAAVRQKVSRAAGKLENFLNDECALYNPQGSCRCRMKRWVEEIHLPQEYEKIREMMKDVNVYQASETVLPQKNYWEKYL